MSCLFPSGNCAASRNKKTQNLEIKNTGKVNGDIKTEAIEIELGAQYNGKLEMHQPGKTENKVAVKA
ncbi:polymer-forming cytoskeletal protein [Pedobacter riviphilus]|uniref:Polymer-forming cytoskeletal protein n=1 Tax=Pedobacter riviphilus TaxID=2766984 RepID=A0ABX6TTY7_9SPHI|nr:polymer-forming cytoskeletal protein [Pedobacter riviphilus]